MSHPQRNRKPTAVMNIGSDNVKPKKKPTKKARSPSPLPSSVTIKAPKEKRVKKVPEKQDHPLPEPSQNKDEQRSEESGKKDQLEPEKQPEQHQPPETRPEEPRSLEEQQRQQQDLFGRLEALQALFARHMNRPNAPSGEISTPESTPTGLSLPPRLASTPPPGVPPAVVAQAPGNQRPVAVARCHIADVTPLTDYLRLVLDDARVVTRTEPVIRGLSKGKGSRQLVNIFLAARPRPGRVEPTCIQVSVWGPVGEVVPTSPAVGDILRQARGFTSSVATAPFDKWHPVELQTTFADFQFDVVADANTIGWERELNPNRSVIDRRPSTSTSTPPIMTSSLAQLPSPSPTPAKPKFCPECGAALIGVGRVAVCTDGSLHPM